MNSTTASASSILAGLQFMTLPWPTTPWPAYSGALIGLIALVQGLITASQRAPASKVVTDTEKSEQSPYRYTLHWSTTIAPRNILLGAAIIALYYTDHYKEMGIVICGLAAFFGLDAIAIAGNERPHLGSMVFCGLVGLLGATNAEPGPWAPWPALSGALIGLIALVEGLLMLVMLFSRPARSGEKLSGIFLSGQSPYRGWAMIDAVRNTVFGTMIVALFCTGHYSELGIVISSLNLSFFLDSIGMGLVNNEHPRMDLTQGSVYAFIGVVGAANVFQWTWGPFES